MSGQTPSYKMTTAFERDLHAPILEGLVTVGRFLPPEAPPSAPSAVVKLPPPALSLACASTGQRVILHNNNSNAKVAKQSAKSGRTVPGSAEAMTTAESTLQTLNFGREATALATGHALSGSGDAAGETTNGLDVLLFGSATSLLAYDVSQNRQLFYKEVEDGVRAVACGPVHTTAASGGGDVGSTAVLSTPRCREQQRQQQQHQSLAVQQPVLAMVGGNCGIYGYDGVGTERYWAVTGDQVTALALMPWQSASTSVAAPGLAVVSASEDYEIRVFDGEEVVASVTEVDRVRQLVPRWQPATARPSPHRSRVASHGRLTEAAQGTAGGEREERFAYLLDNGTVGVYERGERVWRVKGRSVPVAAAFCDVDCDGVDELVVGWRSGRVEVRGDGPRGGGAVLFRDQYTAPVAAVVAADYRDEGRTMPLVCTTDGVVRGLALQEHALEAAVEVRVAIAADALAREKERLAGQLALLRSQLALQAQQQQQQQPATMPAVGAVVQYECKPNYHTHLLDLVFTVHDARAETVIESCVLRSGEGTLDGRHDILCGYAAQPARRLKCQLACPRNVAVTGRASVAVGLPFAENYQVHEVDFSIPAFVMYQPARQAEKAAAAPAGPYDYGGIDPTDPSGHVDLTFPAALRLDELARWLRRTFSLADDLSLTDAKETQLRLRLVHVRDGTSLIVEARNDGADGGALTLRGASMEACGDIIAALVSDLGETGLTAVTAATTAPVTRCEFAEDWRRLRATLDRVQQLNETRVKLTSDMADTAVAVKSWLVSAEDFRMLGDMAGTRKAYTALHDINRELLGEDAKLLANQEELKVALRDVHTAIQHAGRLRIGKANRATFIDRCREALRASKAGTLVDIMRTGEA